MKARLSAKALLLALTDPRELELFRRRHRLDSSAGSPSIDPFKAAVEQGLRLTKISLVECPEDDDDWIELEFHGTDPGWSKISPS